MSRVRRSDLLFMAGGESFSRYGVFSRRTHPSEDVEETFTRTGTAYYLDRNGVLKIAEANAVRTEWLDLDGDGIFETPAPLLEDVRTMVALWNRDLTNAVWTAVTCTVAKDQTGADGVANAASSLTATAGNATVLQAITLASSARFQSAYVKRITGSGTIQMTMDNGATWTAVTVTSAWTRVTIPTQTLANPTVGFRIATNGDAIAVDYVQNENGPSASSAVATTTAAVTRNAEILYIPSPWPPQEMAIYGKILNWVGGQVSGTLFHIGSATATTDPRIVLSITGAGALQAVYDDGTTVASTGTVSAPSSDEDVEFLVTLSSAGVVDLAVSIDGGAQIDVSSASGGALPSAWADTRLYVNSAGSTQVGFNRVGAIKGARVIHTMPEMRAA